MDKNDKILTLREYFSGKALQGHTPNWQLLVGARRAAEEGGYSMVDWVAHSSLEYADAMIKALEESK